MPLRVGINGFGSIGRRFFRIAMGRPGMEIVAVNDLTSPATLAHLLKYDSTYGTLAADVEALEGAIRVQGRTVRILAERDPGALPWSSLGVEVVVESTGLFTQREKAAAHLNSGGAKKVVISAPAKGEDLTVVMGVNQDRYDPARHHVISNASCTTNGLAPVAKVLDDAFGIERGLMTTIHSYTNDQRILDLPHKDLRRARAAAVNIIPTTTGAARAIGKVLPQLEGRMNGMSFRVPTPSVSVVDLVATLRRPAEVDEVNDAMERAAATGPLQGILGVSREPLVSSDFRGTSLSSVVDALSTMAVADLVKVVAWYDNEWGYSTRLVDLVEFIGEQGL
ncbi:MAG: type I glyceraldehyde-3-phosphate dehydrogenase [Thermaerobacter sp.]|nr:type I glyceraldehyde-3-phosphate dehydrogenase [Thermaerobacter sp.]